MILSPQPRLLNLNGFLVSFIAAGIVFVGVSLVFKEIERRTVYTLLAQPVRRWQFLVGKYVGLLAVLTMNLVLMTAVLAAILAGTGSLVPAVAFSDESTASDPAAADTSLALRGDRIAGTNIFYAKAIQDPGVALTDTAAASNEYAQLVPRLYHAIIPPSTARLMPVT